MEDTVVLVEKLKQAWRDLSVDVQKNKKLKFEMFEDTFSQTYALLSKHSVENSLDKTYIELIAEAFLFANIKDDALDNICLASLVLTERMLACCAFCSTPTLAESSTIYVVEARKDILLNFNDINESVSKLTKVFDEMYWKNVNS